MEDYYTTTLSDTRPKNSDSAVKEEMKKLAEEKARMIFEEGKTFEYIYMVFGRNDMRGMLLSENHCFFP